MMRLRLASASNRVTRSPAWQALWACLEKTLKDAVDHLDGRDPTIHSILFPVKHFCPANRTFCSGHALASTPPAWSRYES